MSTDILARTLERCGVRVEILGFTTRAWKGGAAREQWLSDGKPPNPGVSTISVTSFIRTPKAPGERGLARGSRFSGSLRSNHQRCDRARATPETRAGQTRGSGSYRTAERRSSREAVLSAGSETARDHFHIPEKSAAGRARRTCRCATCPILAEVPRAMQRGQAIRRRAGSARAG